jgi:signal transduction histidine kinase
MVRNLPNEPDAITERLRNVAHEMRTPLNAVLGFAQLLRHQGGDVTPMRDAYLGYIETAALQLSAMVADLVDLPNLEVWALSLKREWVVIQNVAQDALTMVEPSAAQSGMRIVCAEGAPELTAFADPTRVLQVLLNLLSNAIKYGRGPAARVDVTLNGSPDGRFARLAVQDHGPGLTPEQTHKLFQPFERLGAERTSTEGTGIGLYISRGIARAMGGDLEVVSRPGCGSAFTLVLPRHAG